MRKIFILTLSILILLGNVFARQTENTNPDAAKIGTSDSCYGEKFI